MATIQFKCKVQNNGWIKLPTLTSRHCDMAAFRSHPKYGGLANSTLFPALLYRIRNEVFNNEQYIKPDDKFDNVSIDTSGFLTVVTIEI